MKIFPKETDFFEIFDRAASNIKKAAELLVSLTENFDNLSKRAKEIYEVEQDGDLLTNEKIKQDLCHAN